MISRKKTKKLVGTLLLLLIIVVFAGCSANNNNETAKPVETTKPAETATTNSDYPNKPVNVFVAWGQGGGTDNSTRAFIPHVEKYLGKSLVITNKPGAAGSVGTNYVANAKPDGYSILSNAEAVNYYKVLGTSEVDLNDMEIIMDICAGYNVLVVPKDSPFKTFDDFINYAKEHPGEVDMASTGPGGTPFVISAMMSKVDDVKFNLVTFDGGGPAVTALLGGKLDASGDAITVYLPYIESGDVRPLAVFSNEKVDVLPDAPALGQISPKYAEYVNQHSVYYMHAVPKGTPQVIIDTLTEAYKKAIKEEEFQKWMKAQGMVEIGLTGEEAKAYNKEWQAKMSWLVYDAGAAKFSPEKFGIARP